MATDKVVENAKDGYFTLNDGTLHPTRGFGTYKLGVIPASASGSGGVARILEEDVTEIVKLACDTGYRFFDCAEFYEQEDRVGEAIKSCGVPRESLFIASKVWTTAIYEGPEAVRKQAMQSMSKLGVTYLDLYLLHWPVPGKHVAAYKELEKMKDEGLIKSIGVSNYTIEDAKELESSGIKYFPAVNQIEVNPLVFRSKTIKYFQSKGTLIQAYRSLGNGKLLQNDFLLELAEKYERKIVQILGRFLLQQGICPLAKSSKPSRIQDNFDITGFNIENADIESLINMTTEETLIQRAELYKKCIIRDTPLAEMQKNNEEVGIREEFTIH